MSKILKLLLHRLLHALFPAPVDGGDGADADPGADDSAGDDDAGEDQQLALGLSEDDDNPESQDDQPAERPRARERVSDVERRAAEAERLARETSEQVRRLQQPQATEEQRLFQEEEQRLRDPNATELERWQINANRQLRASQQASQQALMRAQDMADLTQYQAQAARNPVYSKYEQRVEAELVKARAQGQNLPRQVILQLLVGQDMLSGKLKKAPAANTIPRGKPTGARSDVQGRPGAKTEREKRVERLQNLNI